MGIEKGGAVVKYSDGRREGRGRGEKKRAAQAIEALAVRMVETSDALCKRLPISDELREALTQARNTTARSARKRQIKYLAGLLRRDEESTAAVRKTLETAGRTNRAERDVFRYIEELRDAVCDPDRFPDSVDNAVAELPGLDRRELTHLARKVHRTGDKRASREIFRRIRAQIETDG